MENVLCLNFALLAILLQIIPHFSLGRSSESKKNVLMIVVDDLRPSLGCYGDLHAFTPNIDALAKQSYLFSHAFAQQALCGPSRSSFLTSRSPCSLHQYDVHQYWRSSAGNFTTLPQFFKENGYLTASFGKVFHPGKCSNFSDDQPFSWSRDPFHPSTEHFKNAAVCPSLTGFGPSRSIVCPVNVKLQPGGTLPDLQTLQAVQNFISDLQKASHSQPFFIAVGFHKPHIPLKFPQRFLKYHPLHYITLPTLRSRPPGAPPPSWNPWLDLKDRDDIHQLNISFPWGTMPDKWATLVKQSYYASVSYVDDLIGKLLRKLSTQKLRNETVILLTSDHGWSLGEHGEWSKYSNYEVATQVPLLIHVPGTSGRHINNLVELLDIFPTLADVANVREHMPKCSREYPELLCTEGRSLGPLMKQQQIEQWRDAVLSVYPRPNQYPTQSPNSDQPRSEEIRIMGYSIRTPRHRYTQWVAFNSEKNSPDWSRIYGSELYDHTIDGGENLNLSGRESLTLLEASLHLKLRSVVDSTLL